MTTLYKNEGAKTFEIFELFNFDILYIHTMLVDKYGIIINT